MFRSGDRSQRQFEPGKVFPKASYGGIRYLIFRQGIRLSRVSDNWLYKGLWEKLPVFGFRGLVGSC